MSQTLLVTTDADCLVDILLEQIRDRPTSEQMRFVRESIALLTGYAENLAEHVEMEVRKEQPV